jgi:hypothetical protein
MNRINREDLLAALDLFERQCGDDPFAAVGFSTITSDRHMIAPFGQGVAVTVNAFGVTAFEKSAGSFCDAMARAIARVRLRATPDPVVLAGRGPSGAK